MNIGGSALRGGAILLVVLLSPIASWSKTYQGFSVFGQKKYPDNFKNFDYVNPKAPKGGIVTLGVEGSFNSLNPYIVLGNPAEGVWLTVARLMQENYDRPGECYPYLASSMEIDPEGRYVIFNLNPAAKFSDGVPITADTVIWSFEILKQKGFPSYKSYYKNVTAVSALDKHRVRFQLDKQHNPEMPLILGQLPILPKHFFEKVSFSSTFLTPPPSSGPYQIVKVEPGHRVVYKRVREWWGEKIPSQVGHYNFDELRYDYYYDDNALFEAFKAGKVDFRQETSMKRWKLGYNIVPVSQHLITLEEMKHTHNTGTYGFFFNLRRPLFADVRVREALTLAFDFHWANKNLFFNGYKRNESYFPNSCFAGNKELSSDEKQFLFKYRGSLPPRVWQETFALPSPKEAQERRKLLLKAKELLEEAGWGIRNGKLVHHKTGAPFRFQLLMASRPMEKIALSFKRNLSVLGIEMSVVIPDSTAFTHRVEHKNYDMVFTIIPQSDSLGNEQRKFFGSFRAHQPGSSNFSGIENPVVDDIIEQVIQAPTYEELCLRGRALDRVLTWNFYMIPAWHMDAYMVAYWNKFSRANRMATLSPLLFHTWWYDAQKAQGVKKFLKES